MHAAQFAKLSSLSDIGRVDLLVVLRRQAGFDAARQIELLAAISRDDPSNEKWSVQEIAAVLRIAPATAATHVHRAELLTTTLRKPRWRRCGPGTSPPGTPSYSPPP